METRGLVQAALPALQHHVVSEESPFRFRTERHPGSARKFHRRSRLRSFDGRAFKQSRIASDRRVVEAETPLGQYRPDGRRRRYAHRSSHAEVQRQRRGEDRLHTCQFHEKSPTKVFLWLVDAAPEFSQAVRLQSPYERKRPGG